MKKPIFLKQSKPLIATILGTFILLLMLFLLYKEAAGLSQLITMACMGILLLGYSISFEISNTLNHKRHFSLFGITVFKQRLDCISPDYISVFSAVFKKDSEWGPVAAMGNQTWEGNYVVRFFKGNLHFTVWRVDSLDVAKAKAIELGELLNVEVRYKK
ncbi:hypothetical protein FEE95_05950 [Maribacter algarum]|uniref:Uncharacterized protein n=1 Tax=Maribacter algarum (ex Zhang et al. 2020) TaxID=2578118 RepID=A0A5S3PVG8_9FLAO|nr:hypothetical protein [Maribacter algarum]TMM58975.1 hypothetical protein FEE95_05950 [Maribacter algarum]